MTRIHLKLTKNISQKLIKLVGYAPMIICATLLLTGCGKERKSESMDTLSEIAEDGASENSMRVLGYANNDEKKFLNSIRYETGYPQSTKVCFTWTRSGSTAYRSQRVDIYYNGTIARHNFPVNSVGTCVELKRLRYHVVEFSFGTSYNRNRRWFNFETKKK